MLRIKPYHFMAKGTEFKYSKTSDVLTSLSAPIRPVYAGMLALTCPK